MAVFSRFPKPSMTDFPKELGKQIFSEIENSVKPDREKMHQEALRMEKAMKEKWERKV